MLDRRAMGAKPPTITVHTRAVRKAAFAGPDAEVEHRSVVDFLADLVKRSSSPSTVRVWGCGWDGVQPGCHARRVTDRRPAVG